MRFKLLLSITVSSAWLLLPGCNTTDAPNDDNLETEEAATRAASNVKDKSPDSDLKALEFVTGSHAALNHAVQDVHAILVAQERQTQGDSNSTVKAWYDAMTQSRGAFGKMAFEGWVRAYAEQLGKVVDPTVMARLLIAESKSGAVSPYMTDAALTTDVALKPQLRALVSKWLKTETVSPPSQKGEMPSQPGIPSSDPLLIKTAAGYCLSSKDSTWTQWRDTLAPTIQQYWLALTTHICGRNVAAAIQTYKVAYATLGKKLATQSLAVEAAGRCATLQRANGHRIEAADTYSDLVALWDNPGVTPASLGLDSPVAMSLRRIDETLWASRYRALIGDLENAKIFAQLGLSLAKDTRAHRRQLKKGQRDQLASLTVDAYHTLASRILVEQRQFASAVSLTILALKTPDLSMEWRDRLAWAAGVYEYLDGNFASAQKHWQKVLANSPDESQRIAASFWIARCLEKQGRKTEAELAITALMTQSPLSYYSTIAAEEAKLATKADWQKVIGDLDGLAPVLAERKDFHLQSLRASPELGRLLARAEILVAARLQRMARLAVSELEAEMTNKLQFKESLSSFVYLSRLQYRAGAYLAAIGTTSRLAKNNPEFWHQWPEQLLIFFPQPYADLYTQNAASNELPRSLLLGISRQESGFTPDIRSHANAVGLMQLIHPTARKYAIELGLSAEHLDEQLKDPAVNIRIGTHYLKQLNSNYKGFSPAVYGGYNAGEFAMDAWLKRRSHSDSLLFVELVPFGETREYIKNVWRNVAVYDRLSGITPPLQEPGFDLGFAAFEGA